MTLPPKSLRLGNMTMSHLSNGIATPIAGIQQLDIEGDGCGGVKIIARRNEIEITFGCTLGDVGHLIQVLRHAAGALVDNTEGGAAMPASPRENAQ